MQILLTSKYPLKQKIKLHKYGVFFKDNVDINDASKRFILKEEGNFYKLYCPDYDNEDSYLINKNDKYDAIISNNFNLNNSRIMFKLKDYDVNFIANDEHFYLYEERVDFLKEEHLNIIEYINYISNQIGDSFGIVQVTDYIQIIVENNCLSKIILELAYHDESLRGDAYEEICSGFNNSKDLFEEYSKLKINLKPLFYEKSIQYNNTLYIVLNYNKFKESNLGKSLFGIKKFNL